MPKAKYKGRGRVLRYRTLSLGKGKYTHVAVLSKSGPKGGKTMIGKIYSSSK